MQSLFKSNATPFMLTSLFCPTCCSDSLSKIGYFLLPPPPPKQITQKRKKRDKRRGKKSGGGGQNSICPNVICNKESRIMVFCTLRARIRYVFQATDSRKQNHWLNCRKIKKKKKNSSTLSDTLMQENLNLLRKKNQNVWKALYIFFSESHRTLW